MPIYAYRCSVCGHAKDVLQKLSDPVLSTCPACGAEAFSKQVTAAGFQLKGSGWYVTDFRDGNKGAGKADGGDKADKPDTAPKSDQADAGGKATEPAAPAAAPAAPAAAPAPAPAPASTSGAGSSGGSGSAS